MCTSVVAKQITVALYVVRETISWAGKLIFHYFCPPSSMTSDLSQLVPRLWPFLYHSSSVVRGSALKTLHTLTACAGSITTTTTTGPQFSTQHTTVISAPPLSGTITTTTSSTTTSTEEPQLFTTTAPLHSKTTMFTPVINTTATITAQIADSDTTSESLSTTTVTTTEKRNVDGKNHELCVKKECMDEEQCETDQESGAGVVVSKGYENVNKRTESLVVKHESKIKSEDINVPSTIKSENGELDSEDKCCKNSGSSSVGVECPWLPPIIQQVLTHIYQRALLEESDENLQLVFKVSRQLSFHNVLAFFLF